jgi:ketosteroid isomerase-like protein
MQVDPEAEAVREANLAFYQAFASPELAQMCEVWERSDAIRCVHPGWPLLKGWDAVMRSWEAIFTNTTLMQFAITGTCITVVGDWVWVACAENVTSVVEGRVLESTVQATNIYRKREGRWLMVYHHGTPVA